jgi:hypothetical protein
MCGFRMLCTVCLEVDWHRTWCDYHPINRQTSAWPPALQVATPTGEWLHHMSQRPQTDEGNLSGEVIDDTPLIGLLSLGTGVNLGGSVHNMFTTDEDEQQSEVQDRSLNNDTWNLIEDVLGGDNDGENIETSANQNSELSERNYVGPQTPAENSPTQDMKIDQMWVSANDLQYRAAKRVAHVRPQAAPVRRRAMVHRRRGTIPPEFRMVVQAPVVQTHDVVSRITMADGMVMEESMRLRCAIAEDVATQTVLTMAMIAVALGETQPEDMATEVPEVAEVIDLTTDEQTGEESTGTPVQDERLP